MGAVVAGTHVVETEAQRVVPSDAVAADVEEPEAEIAVAVVGRSGGLAPGRVGVAVGERQRARPLDPQQGQCVAMTVPGHEVLGLVPEQSGSQTLTMAPDSSVTYVRVMLLATTSWAMASPW